MLIMVIAAVIIIGHLLPILIRGARIKIKTKIKIISIIFPTSSTSICSSSSSISNSNSSSKNNNSSSRYNSNLFSSSSRI